MGTEVEGDLLKLKGDFGTQNQGFKFQRAVSLKNFGTELLITEWSFKELRNIVLNRSHS